MRTATAFITMLFAGCLLIVGLAQAQVPEKLAYQGLLTTEQGQPIADGQYRVTFRLYAEDVAGEPAGEALFTETQTVSVAGGLFSTLIGKEALLELPFDRPYHLTVELAGQAESEPVALLASPYALQARDVEDGAVVRSISGLRDEVEIVAGEGIAIRQQENKLVISALRAPVGLRGAGQGQPGEEAPALLGPGGSNVGLDAAYDAGRIITADGGAVEVHGLGAGGVAARVLNGDLLVEDNTGGKPNIRFKTSGGAIGTQEWRFNLNAIGHFTIRDNTGGANVFAMIPGAASGLMRLRGNQVLVHQTSPTGSASLYVNASPNLDGVQGVASSIIGWGLYGVNTSATGSIANGVLGITSSEEAPAVRGINQSVEGNNPYGELAGLDDLGVFQGGDQHEQYGAYGRNRNSTKWDLNGFLARSVPQDLGEFGLGHDNDGVFGSVDCEGLGSNGLGCHAIHGKARNPQSNELAGRFDGNVRVNGNHSITGTLTKGGGAFKIDHPLDPENKYLLHSFVESPDMMNVYNGNIVLDAQGEAWIELPAYFDALNSDYRYQLTAIGAPGPNLYVAEEISGNRFKVAGGEPGTKVSWQVTGVRQDAWAKAHRIPTEEWKRGKAQGRYLHPRELGKPIEMGIYAEPPVHAAEARAQGNDRND